MGHRPAVGGLLSAAMLAASLLVGPSVGAAVGAAALQITGTVRGPGGEPVEGAIARAHVVACPSDVGPLPEVILDESPTASDGTYVLDVTEGCYLVEVVPPEAGGLASGWWGGAGAPTSPARPAWLVWLAITSLGGHPNPIAIPGTVADVPLGAPVHLGGVVTYEGAPLAGATVRVGVRPPIGAPAENEVHEIAAEVLTDASGAWTLEGFGPATWAIDVVPPSGSEAARTFGSGCAAPPLFLATIYYQTEDVGTWPLITSGCLGGVLVASGASASIDADLPRGPSIEGVVRTSGGVPVPGVAVVIRALDCGGSSGYSWRHDSWPVLTAADGSYRIVGLRPGPKQHLMFTPSFGSPLIAEGGDGWYGATCGTFPELELASGDELEQSPVLEATCAGPGPFTDVGGLVAAFWGATCGEVAWLEGAGITNGWPDGTFRPSSVLSRGAWITWLWRQAGMPGPYPDPGFSDVPPSSLFHPAVAWAAATGVAHGYANGAFGAARPVTVQAAITMVWRRAGSPTSPTNVLPATDLYVQDTWSPPSSNPFRTPIRWGLASNLITIDVLMGMPPVGCSVEPVAPPGWDCVDPGDPATRALATSILHDATARTAP